MTLNDLKKLTYRDELWHVSLKNADGTPARCRVNGQIKLWKTRPNDFKLPVKFAAGLTFYIEPHNADEWQLPE